MLRPSAAIIVGTAAGYVSVAGARRAAGRHMATSASQVSPRGSAIDDADDRDAWFFDGANDTSELSPFATAIVVDPRP
jgi:hypothetical protein